MPYGRDQIAAIANDLVAHGLAVWNMEYCRLGAPQAAWTATMDDIAAGIGHLADLCTGGIDVDLDRVIVVGHSAGGHLALWAAGRSHARTPHCQEFVYGLSSGWRLLLTSPRPTSERLEVK